MPSFDDIRPGVRLRGLDSAGVAEVVQVARFGADALNLVFRANGRVFREHEELFTETSWLAVMVGQGIVASGYHPAADLLPDAETLKRLMHIREVVGATAEAMSTQDEFLRAHGSWSEVAARRAS